MQEAYLAIGMFCVGFLCCWLLVVVIGPNDTTLKTASICSALQISLRIFQRALLGFVFCALAATNIAAGFSV